MAAETLTSDRILEAAEDVLRRYGPAKANVVDVARALGVSHGSVYRHFPSKAVLRDAVTERWLSQISEPLETIADGKGSAPERLRRWLDLLVASKRMKAFDDPELFATYIALAAEAREVVRKHVGTPLDQLSRIVADGVAQGELVADDPGRQRVLRSTRQAASTTPCTRRSGGTRTLTPRTRGSAPSSSAV
jgi:AcrR family transcriptional regulator